LRTIFHAALLLAFGPRIPVFIFLIWQSSLTHLPGDSYQMGTFFGLVTYFSYTHWTYLLITN